MTKQERLALESRLAELDANEKQKLFKRAAQMRKLTQKKNGTRPRRSYAMSIDHEDPQEQVLRQPRSSLHDWALRILELEEPDAVSESATGLAGTVIAIGPRSAEVVFGDAVLTCAISSDLAAKQASEIAVGDLVDLRMRSDESGLIVGVRPRRTKLSRPDPSPAGFERVIVANVDVVVVVVSLASPPLHPRIIDRYLIAIRRGGAQPVICVNKIDLLSGDDLEREFEALRPYERLGIPLVRCSASQHTGSEALRSLLSAKTSAFVGHSGVGKSSLLNALKPDLQLQVGDVSEGYGRGTHTTTRSTMWRLDDDTRIIDTPGVRSFGLWNLTRAELPWYFPEFASTGRCRFRDCAHTHEPGCAVKEAIETGEISRDRYETYLRILESL